MITKSSEEAEREVEASRTELNRTVEALKDRMTPGQLFDEAVRMSGGAGQQVMAKFLDQAKANPMPLAVMGVGLAWLMTSNNRPSGYGERRSFAPADGSAMTYYDTGADGEGLTDKVSGAMSGVGDRAADMAGSAKHAISGAAGSARGALSSAADAARTRMHDGKGALSDAASGAARTAKDAAQKVGSAAGDAAQKAGEVGHKAQDALADLLQREPLLAGGLGLLLGLAVGAALPSTEAEDRLLGTTRDRVLEKGKALAQDKIGDAKEVAQAAFDSAKGEIQKGVGDGQDLAETAQRAVQAGIDTVKDQGQDLVRH